MHRLLSILEAAERIITSTSSVPLEVRHGNCEDGRDDDSKDDDREWPMDISDIFQPTPDSWSWMMDDGVNNSCDEPSSRPLPLTFALMRDQETRMKQTKERGTNSINHTK